MSQLKSNLKESESRSNGTAGRIISADGSIYKPLNTIVLKASKLRNAIFQRPTDPVRVKSIINEFRMENVNPIKVYANDKGQFMVYDGQHTLMAILEKFSEYGDIDITCVLLDVVSEEFEGLTVDEAAARIFAKQHDNTAKLSNNNKFNALVIGKDKAALEILDSCKKFGFSLDYRDGQYARENVLACTSTLVKIYNKTMDTSLLDRTLYILRKAYDGSEESLNAKFIWPIAEFIHRMDSQAAYSDAAFIKALANYVYPNEILKKAKEIADTSKVKYGTSYSVNYSMQLKLTEYYNTRKQERNRLIFGK